MCRSCSASSGGTKSPIHEAMISFGTAAFGCAGQFAQRRRLCRALRTAEGGCATRQYTTDGTLEKENGSAQDTRGHDRRRNGRGRTCAGERGSREEARRSPLQRELRGRRPRQARLVRREPVPHRRRGPGRQGLHRVRVDRRRFEGPGLVARAAPVRAHRRGRHPLLPQALQGLGLERPELPPAPDALPDHRELRSGTAPRQATSRSTSSRSAASCAWPPRTSRTRTRPTA